MTGNASILLRLSIHSADRYIPVGNVFFGKGRSEIMSYYEGKETASSWWRHGVSLLSGADKKFALSLYLRPISLSLRLRQSLPASRWTLVGDECPARRVVAGSRPRQIVSWIIFYLLCSVLNTLPASHWRVTEKFNRKFLPINWFCLANN